MNTPCITAIVQKDVLEAPNGLPAKVVADDMGKNYYTLLRELNPHHASHKFGADDLVPAMRATGSRRPLAAMADALDMAVVEIPQCEGELTTAMQHCIKTIASFSQLMESVMQAYADGTITREEYTGSNTLGRLAVGEILALLDRMDRESA